MPIPSDGAAALGPEAGPFEALVEGVLRFQKEVFPGRRQQFRRLASGQRPHTLFIACADSRVMPEMITQADPGELFVCRNIGNIVPAHGEMTGGVSAIVEYACVALGVSHVVVCGHSDCGAMKALLDPAEPGLKRVPAVASWLRNAAAARSVVEVSQPALQDSAKVQALVEQNVRTQLQNLRTHPAVAARLAAGDISLHGWLYDIEGGTVSTLDEAGGAAMPLGQV